MPQSDSPAAPAGRGMRYLRTARALTMLVGIVGLSACQVETLERGFPPGIAPLEVAERYRQEGGPAQPVRPVEPCTVTRIVDGDTIDCEPVGRIRLIGIDTPEREQVPFGAQASGVLQTLLPVGTDVQAERDVENLDTYDRALRYIWLDGVLVNWIMVRSGYAELLTFPPNVQYVDAFASARTMARDGSDGLWATGGFACEPVAFRQGRCP